MQKQWWMKNPEQKNRTGGTELSTDHKRSQVAKIKGVKMDGRLWQDWIPGSVLRPCLPEPALSVTVALEPHPAALSLCQCRRLRRPEIKRAPRSRRHRDQLAPALGTYVKNASVRRDIPGPRTGDEMTVTTPSLHAVFCREE
ncbi:hypothetical protein COCON_G00123100 [Conger conger]|uniref:Uncharacterized protein n=1 Tax=Conger conger TaxID=82655 RepID=A0A9Q1DHG3_CONCO|nr:hypothetical protein COCON_G00123100 [Conger conger]